MPVTLSNANQGRNDLRVDQSRDQRRRPGRRAGSVNRAMRKGTCSARTTPATIASDRPASRIPLRRCPAAVSCSYSSGLAYSIGCSAIATSRGAATKSRRQVTLHRHPGERRRQRDVPRSVTPALSINAIAVAILMKRRRHRRIPDHRRDRDVERRRRDQQAHRQRECPMHAARQREEQPHIGDRLQQRDGDPAGVRQVVHERRRSSRDRATAASSRPAQGRGRPRCDGAPVNGRSVMPPSAIAQSRVCSPSIRNVVATSYVRIHRTYRNSARCERCERAHRARFKQSSSSWFNRFKGLTCLELLEPLNS